MELTQATFGNVDASKCYILEKEGVSGKGRFMKVNGTPHNSLVRSWFGGTNAVNLDTMRPAIIADDAVVTIVGQLLPKWF